MELHTQTHVLESQNQYHQYVESFGLEMIDDNGLQIPQLILTVSRKYLWTAQKNGLDMQDLVQESLTYMYELIAEGKLSDLDAWTNKDVGYYYQALKHHIQKVANPNTYRNQVGGKSQYKTVQIVHDDELLAKATDDKNGEKMESNTDTKQKDFIHKLLANEDNLLMPSQVQLLHIFLDNNCNYNDTAKATGRAYSNVHRSISNIGRRLIKNGYDTTYFMMGGDK